MHEEYKDGSDVSLYRQHIKGIARSFDEENGEFDGFSPDRCLGSDRESLSDEGELCNLEGISAFVACVGVGVGVYVCVCVWAYVCTVRVDVYVYV